jgi:hypothetical protein
VYTTAGETNSAVGPDFSSEGTPVGPPEGKAVEQSNQPEEASPVNALGEVMTRADALARMEELSVLIDSYPTPARRSELEALRRFVDRLDDVGHGTEAEA